MSAGHLVKAAGGASTGTSTGGATATGGATTAGATVGVGVGVSVTVDATVSSTIEDVPAVLPGMGNIGPMAAAVAVPPTTNIAPSVHTIMPLVIFMGRTLILPTDFY